MAARFAFAVVAGAAIARAQLFSDDDYYTTTTRSTSAYWTYTARYVESVSEDPYTFYDDSVTTDTYTITRTVKDNVTPMATPYSTTSDYNYYYDDLQIVYAYYPIGAVAESDLEPPYDYYATTTTASTTTTVKNIDFSMPVTMTAPASCPTPFTVTTSASVDIPSQVTAQVSPTSVDTYSSSTAYDNTVYVWETWYLSESAAPFTTTSDYYYSYYISDCSTPPAAYRTASTSSGTGSNGGSISTNDDGSSYDSCYYYYCTSRLRLWIIIVVTVIPGLFLLGFLESWFWFRRLMLGKSAMRFGTCCWVLISLWVLCFTRMQDRRSTEDQKLLAEKWKSMGSGAAFKAWWKWGFRHRYPEELLGQFSKTTVGIVPPGQPLHPAMAQTPGVFQPVPNAPGQVYYYGPPPPGWVQGPNGGFVPPQGYMYPPPQQAGYYGDMVKDGTVVSQSPVSAMGHPQPQQQIGNVSPTAPQAPQPVHPAPQNGAHTPTPYGAPPNVGSAPAPAPAPSPPPQSPLPTPPPQAAGQGPPKIPPVIVSDASVETSARQQPTAPAASAHPPKNDSNDRDLYE